MPHSDMPLFVKNKHATMKRQSVITFLLLLLTISIQAANNPQLTFDASCGESRLLVMPNGQTIHFTAYEKLYYVTHVEDSAYQYMNVYVPDGATKKTPILLRTYVGGYMAAAAAEPQATDATGRALAEGYVVAIPGARGRNSTITRNNSTIYTGRAPAGLLDLKAAVRYLRFFDKKMPGSAERIITDGTSAGGAMSSLLGATGNNPAYEPMLKAMGAADTRDDVYASICFCPIIDLDHADMAYEWLYNCTNNNSRPLSPEQAIISNELAAAYPAYFNSLGLTDPSDGSPLTADNFRSYIKWQIIRAAQIAKDAGAEIPDSIGFTFSEVAGFMPPVNGGIRTLPEDITPPAAITDTVPTKTQRMQAAAQLFNRRRQGNSFYIGGAARLRPQRRHQQGEYIVNLDMETYLNYVVSTQPLKTPPAFDALDVAGAAATGENEVFGNEEGSSVNFTDYSAQHNGKRVERNVRVKVRQMNPWSFLDDKQTNVAPHWYIRHGARDRDTSFAIPVAFAVKLQNIGKDVNFLLAWNRPHCGDYSLDELFSWIRSIQ